jgi:hypothetical protein
VFPAPRDYVHSRPAQQELLKRFHEAEWEHANEQLGGAIGHLELRIFAIFGRVVFNDGVSGLLRQWSVQCSECSEVDNIGKNTFKNGARCRFRTYDPYRVKVMLYH